MKHKLIRITTVPSSLKILLRGQLRFMSQHYEVTAISSEKDYLENVGQIENVATFTLEMTRKITPFQDLKSVLQLFFYLKKTKPFIVHTHTPKAGIVGMFAAKLAGVPHRLHTVAGLPLLEATGTKRKILDRVEKLTYGFATNVYPNSFGLLQIIKDNQYCDPKKLKVLANGSSNGINTEHFSPQHFSEAQDAALRESLAIAATDFVFVFVGRLVRDKGINEMTAAFSKLQKEIANLKLLLVGDFENDLDPVSESTLQELTNNQAIISTGFKDDVRPYFAIADALVFPSYREGFPNVVLQAGAMGLPCIVSNINGCNEIIEENNNGLIIPVKDENAVYIAMKKLVQNDAVRSQMQQNARPMIVSRFEQKVVWEAILEEYRKFDHSNTQHV